MTYEEHEAEAAAERAELAAAYGRVKQHGLENGGFSPSSHDWTDEDIAEYEAWLTGSDQLSAVSFQLKEAA